MTAKRINHVEPAEDRNALLEKQLIEEYLHEMGHSLGRLEEIAC